MYRTLLGVSTEFVLIEGRFYKLVSTESRVSMLLGCIRASRTVSFSISFRRVAHRSVKTKCLGAGATDKQEKRSESPTRFFKAGKSELWG